MKTVIRRLLVGVLALALTPASVHAHDGAHGTPTPTSPLAGVSPLGASVVFVGLVTATTGLLLVREELVSERAGSVAFGVGVALLVAGGVIAFVLG